VLAAGKQGPIQKSGWGLRREGVVYLPTPPAPGGVPGYGADPVAEKILQKQIPSFFSFRGHDDSAVYSLAGITLELREKGLSKDVLKSPCFMLLSKR
jgi:hypothetical protein